MVSYWENNLCSVAPKIPHLSVITMLKKICNHPALIKPEETQVDDNDDSEDFETVKVSFVGNFVRNVSNNFKIRELNSQDSAWSILKPVYEQFSQEITSVELSGKMATLENFLSDLHSLNEKVVLISYYTQVGTIFTYRYV